MILDEEKRCLAKLRKYGKMRLPHADRSTRFHAVFQLATDNLAILIKISQELLIIFNQTQFDHYDLGIPSASSRAEM